MHSAALVLREVSHTAWLDFASGMRRATELARTVPLIDCWSRAEALGASFEGPPAEEHLLRGEALRLHTERTELVERIAAVDLERVVGTVALRDYMILLADPAGVLVRASGGGGFAEEARRVRLIAGACWSESARGTNAIGTAIAELRPVFVTGTAHLARRFHELVCYAAPIFDADGSLVAVIDATSALGRADDSVGEAVIRTARTITEALRDRAFGRASIAVTRTLSRALDRMEGIALLVEPPARVTQGNAGARVLLGEPAGQSVFQLLGVDMSTLVSEANHARGLSVEVGGRPHGVRAEPIETPEGKLIALLVFLEPKAIGKSPRRPSPAEALSADPFAKVFSRDARLDEALAWAGKIADSTVPVLLLAETGSGKELVARAIHAASSRATGPFVAVNCGSVAPSLLESELFGYGPAAFTGAERHGRQGLFSVASGGTIFLDEVAEMPLAMQAALLRVLEDGTYRRVGEASAQHADVRVVSATCRDLGAMVEAGTFRRDLYYRLTGAEVVLPPLRERTDRAALSAHLLSDLARARGTAPAPALSDEVCELLGSHRFPGNVRELRSVLEVSLILVGSGGTIEPAHLPPEFRRAIAACSAKPPEGRSPASDLDGAERSTVHRVLTEVGGNVSRAAKRLGVARSTLYRMMRRHGLVS